METVIHIQVDGVGYEVAPGRNLLETCLALGLDLPYFCFHPALGSVGACRQCAVKKYKDANDQKGHIVMSCMEPIAEGMIISISDPEAKAFRASIIESLMLNHPHDCPVCDEGGECHLQDMTVMTGHDYRRYNFKKRTHNNQYLGPFINHEMNRCIQCYRCVRFYRDYAGGEDLDVFASHDHVYFGRHKEGALENEFSGNLVEVCPTGVFTDKTAQKHYTRKWDLTNAPSVCVHCSVGCNTIASERYGSLRRIMSRYNGSVNGYFLCDRGRFGYEFVNDEKRIREPRLSFSKDKEPEAITGDPVRSALSAALSSRDRIIGIASPRASLESNYALLKLVGQENFYLGISKSENELLKLAVQILKDGPVHSPSLKEIEGADAIFILGEDLTNTAPLMALAIRQASRTIPIERAAKTGIPSWHDTAVRDRMQDLKSPVFIANPFRTNLDELAEETYHASPQEIARLGFAVAALLHDGAQGKIDPQDEPSELARKIASALKESKNPVIIAGIHSGSVEILQAAANVALAIALSGKKAGLSISFPECNTLGLGMMEGKPLADAIELVSRGGVDTVVILENDLYRRAEKEVIDSFLARCKNRIVLDHLENETTLKADILLPVATFAESEGTLVNNEGRAQRFYRVLPREGFPPESWRCIRDMMNIPGKEEVALWPTFNQVVTAMTEDLPVFLKIRGHIPQADFLMLNEKIRRQTSRYSGRTAMHANINVSEPKPPQDPDSPLVFSMEGSDEKPPSSLVPFYWKPGWNSYQAMNFYLNEPNGSMKGGDPGIRLFEPSAQAKMSFFEPGTAEFTRTADKWLILPVSMIFGSEELSSAAPAVAERITKPFLRVNRQDAEDIEKGENELLTLEIGQQRIEASLKVDDSLPPGVAGLSVNFPGMAFVDLPAYGKVSNEQNIPKNIS